MDKGTVSIQSSEDLGGCRLFLPQQGRESRPRRMRVLRQQDFQPRILRKGEIHKGTDRGRKGFLCKEISRHEILGLLSGLQ